MNTLYDGIMGHLLEKGYHCSQVMMQLSLDARGLEDPFVIRALGALGGGLFTQHTCGTLTGAACLLSSYLPRLQGEPEPTAYHKMVQELVGWFEQEYGSLNCCDLVEQDPAAILGFCPHLMENTYEKCTEILLAHGIDPQDDQGMGSAL